MAITSHIKINGYIEGLPTGSRSVTLAEITNALSVDQSIHIELANGDNVIPIPAGASGIVKGVIVTTDPTGTTVKTVRTGAMATGIPIPAANGVHLLTFPTPSPTSITINSVGAEAGKLTQLFFF